MKLTSIGLSLFIFLILDHGAHADFSNEFTQGTTLTIKNIDKNRYSPSAFFIRGTPYQEASSLPAGIGPRCEINFLKNSIKADTPIKVTIKKQSRKQKWANRNLLDASPNIVFYTESNPYISSIVCHTQGYKGDITPQHIRAAFGVNLEIASPSAEASGQTQTPPILKWVHDNAEGAKAN